MLILARRMNERIIIDDNIEVAVLDIKGDQVKIGIRAPKNVKVYRQEVFEAIQAENRRAAETSSRELPSLDQYFQNDRSGNDQAGKDRAGKDPAAKDQRGNNRDDETRIQNNPPDNRPDTGSTAPDP
ncbi:MAG: carbon storage regulator CsrA [Spirochaetaceae bacterium]